MSDLYEMKAAVVAAKENCSLPILASLIFDGSGKLLTGGSPPGRSGPAGRAGGGRHRSQLRPGAPGDGPGIPPAVGGRLGPLLLQPNAGLPRSEGGKTVYDVTPGGLRRPDGGAGPMATLLGGCCGTTPAHLAALIQATKDLPLPEVTWKDTLLISSYCQAVALDGRDPVVIGERINPTGKKKLQAALRAGGHGLCAGRGLPAGGGRGPHPDVNVGLPGLDEPTVLTQTVEAIQAVTGLPLQLDTSNPEAMEAALRRYNGKPLINSVNGKEESLAAILPPGEEVRRGPGVPHPGRQRHPPPTRRAAWPSPRRSSAGRRTWASPGGELLLDGLTMPVSAGGENAKVTLETIRWAKAELGVKTALGVSNVPSACPSGGAQPELLHPGPPGRAGRGHHQPQEQGHDGAYHAYRALQGLDSQCQTYMDAIQHITPHSPGATAASLPPTAPAAPTASGGGHPLPRRVQGPQGGGRRPGQGPGRGGPGHSGHHQRRAGPRPGPGGPGV